MEIPSVFSALTSLDQLEELIRSSATRPQVVVKHSTRCGISAYALHRLSEAEKDLVQEADVYILDLLQYRELSNRIAERFGVFHQSPQLMVIQHGECTLELTHHEVMPSLVTDFLRK